MYHESFLLVGFFSSLIGLLQQMITWYMVAGKLIVIPGTSKQRQVKLHSFRRLCFNVPG